MSTTETRHGADPAEILPDSASEQGLTRTVDQAVASMIDWFVVTITFQGSVGLELSLPRCWRRNQLQERVLPSSNVGDPESSD